MTAHQDPCMIRAVHCADCGSQRLHEGPNDPPPWCCCRDCGSADIVEAGDVCGGQDRTDVRPS